jgi:hypothetical protein
MSPVMGAAATGSGCGGAGAYCGGADSYCGGSCVAHVPDCRGDTRLETAVAVPATTAVLAYLGAAPSRFPV